MSPLTGRWARFAEWIDLFPWTKFQLFLSAGAFIVNTVALYVADTFASVSNALEWTSSPLVLKMDTFETVYTYATIWGGVSVIGAVGKRLSTKPEVIRAETDAVVRRSQAVQAVGEDEVARVTKPLRHDVP